MWTQIRLLLLEQSDLGPHCLPTNVYAKCKFEKFARRCSRRHKQTTFSDADFLGALRVNYYYRNNSYIRADLIVHTSNQSNLICFSDSPLYWPMLKRLPPTLLTVSCHCLFIQHAQKLSYTSYTHTKRKNA